MTANWHRFRRRINSFRFKWGPIPIGPPFQPEAVIPVRSKPIKAFRAGEIVYLDNWVTVFESTVLRLLPSELISIHLLLRIPIGVRFRQAARIAVPSKQMAPFGVGEIMIKDDLAMG